MLYGDLRLPLPHCLTFDRPFPPTPSFRQPTLRAQAVLATGNLACSLHDILCRADSNLRFRSGSPGDVSGGVRGDVVTEDLFPLGNASPSLCKTSRLRSMCGVAMRLATTEPDYAAGSAVRAVSYLAWCLDRDAAGGGDRIIVQGPHHQNTKSCCKAEGGREHKASGQDTAIGSDICSTCCADLGAKGTRTMDDRRDPERPTAVAVVGHHEQLQDSALMALVDRFSAACAGGTGDAPGKQRAEGTRRGGCSGQTDVGSSEANKRADAAAAKCRSVDCSSG